MNENINNQPIKRSNWLKALVGISCLDALLALVEFSFFVFVINIFFADRLWNKSIFWRNVTAYIRIPLGLIAGFICINQYDYFGEGVILGCVIYAVLLLKSWNEFDNNKTKNGDIND